jgi:tRNA (Thr-GGU) A37 N-methylase
MIHAKAEISDSTLEIIRKSVSDRLGISSSSVWTILNGKSICEVSTGSQNHPVIFFHCRISYSNEQVAAAVSEIQKHLASALDLKPIDIFCIVQRHTAENIFSPLNNPMRDQITILPHKPLSDNEKHFFPIHSIGRVNNDRPSLIDDDWGQVDSTITLDPTLLDEDATLGLNDFSHVEVTFYMHLVDPKKINRDSRYPRNNPNWPKVGILAQRGKNRINQIGQTICRIIEVKGLTVIVNGLDAINGTPILDLKPVMKEFLPREEVKQPLWSKDIMKNYF